MLSETRGTEDVPLLDVERLSITIRAGGTVAHPVRDVSFKIASGEVLGIVGESGSGKTLTSLALTGLTVPQAHVSGEVRLRGRNLVGLSGKAMRGIRGREFGYVFQDPQASLNPLMRCGDQVAEALHVHQGIRKEAGSARAVELFDRVGLKNPARCARLYPHELSGGMRQRVMIAIAICCDPSLVIADEPTTALDVVITMQIVDLLREVRERTNAGMLFISHDLKLVSTLADRIAVMYGGRIVESGSAEQVMTQPEHAYTKALVAATPDLLGPRVRRFVGIDERLLQQAASGVETSLESLESSVAGSLTGVQEGPLTVDRPELPAEGTGRQPVGTPGDDRELLDVSDLVVTFGTRHFLRAEPHPVEAVSRVTLRLAQGEILGIVGESGSGKTTLARTLVGLTAPASGCISYQGNMLFPSGGGRYRVPRTVQMVFQDPYASLNPRMRVLDLVAEALDIAGMRRSDPERDRAVDELLRRVGIDPQLRFRFPHQFSGGQRQRIAIARALAAKPQLLVCDEAVSSLDVSIRAHVLNVLATERDRSGLSIIFIGHDLGVIRHLADRIVVMRDGALVEEGPTERVVFAPTHPYTRQLIEASRYESVDQRAS
jgi:peptide/nickel transport system ATP-binding protein